MQNDYFLHEEENRWKSSLENVLMVLENIFIIWERTLDYDVPINFNKKKKIEWISESDGSNYVVLFWIITIITRISGLVFKPKWLFGCINIKVYWLLFKLFQESIKK